MVIKRPKNEDNILVNEEHAVPRENDWELKSAH